jgi:hypothetical protein
MTRAEPRCRDRVCRDDGGRPTTRYTAMRRDEVGRLRRALCPTSDRSRHTLPTFAGPLLPCIPALTCYVLLTAWEYSHRLASSLVLLSYQCSGWLPLTHALPLPLSACHAGIEAGIYLFFAQVSAATNCPEVRSSSYEKGSVGCIGEISR